MVTDIDGNSVTTTEYRIYRAAAPYFITDQSTRVHTMTGPFPAGPVVWLDEDKIGDSTINHFWVVIAVTPDSFGNDLLSENSNRVGGYNLTLMPGSS